MAIELTAGELLVIEQLCQPDTRWHHLEDLIERTGLTLRATRSALWDLRRHELAVQRAKLGHGSAQWSATTLGHDFFDQQKKAPDPRERTGAESKEGAPLPCPMNV